MYYNQNVLFQLSKTCVDEDAQINRKLPKELLLRYDLIDIQRFYFACVL